MTTREYSESEPPETEWERFALQFVRDLVEGNFPAAHEKLSRGLAGVCTTDELRAHFSGIASAKDKPMEEPWLFMSWTDAQESSLFGSAHARIGGDHNEAVTPIVANDGSRMVIGSLEWGRP